MQRGDSEIVAFISDRSQRVTGQQLSLVRALFSNPREMSVRMGRVAQTLAGINTKLLFQFFDKLTKLNLEEVAGDSLRGGLEQLESTESLNQFLRDRQHANFFYVIMFWARVFAHKDNLILLKFLNLFTHLVGSQGFQRAGCEQWCDAIPSQLMKLQVEQLLGNLEGEFQKIAPKVMVEENKVHIVKLNILNICQFLSLLYWSNERVGRLPREQFLKRNFQNYFKPLDVFRLHFQKTNYQLDFMKFPFLLDLDFKYDLLRIESIVEQDFNMQKNIKLGLINLLNGTVQYDVNGNLSLQGFAYLTFQVNRNDLLNDSMEKLCKIQHNLKNPLKIEFVGESGNDEGGIKNQYFNLLIKDIFNPYLDMFLPKNNSRVYWFNGHSYEPPIRFEFVGMLLGLAIYNSVHLNVRFPLFLYRKLLGRGGAIKTTDMLEELNQIQPDYYRGLRLIMDSHEPLDDMELNFTIQTENFGEKCVEELKENGQSIPVTQSNKEEYVNKFCNYLLNTQVDRQFRAFKRGFDKVVDTPLIKMFEPDEIQSIICGLQVIDFKELEESTQYEGYTKDSQVVKNLWKILNQLSLQDKKAFLMFCTGSDRVPLGGLKALKFMIHKHANTDHLPTAQTCFNVFLLPQYESYQKLDQSIRFILKNNEGFGLI